MPSLCSTSPGICRRHDRVTVGKTDSHQETDCDAGRAAHSILDVRWFVGVGDGLYAGGGFDSWSVMVAMVVSCAI